VIRLQTRSQPRRPGRPCWPQAPPEIPGESGPARNSDEIRKRRKAQEMRVPDPMAHDFGLGSDFSEASTPGGRAVRRAEEPSETFGCPANWTAERCFLRRCYRNPRTPIEPGTSRYFTGPRWLTLAKYLIVAALCRSVPRACDSLPAFLRWTGSQAAGYIRQSGPDSLMLFIAEQVSGLLLRCRRLRTIG